MKAKTYRIALTGLLGACAVALSYLESLLPTAAFLPPGAKPGLSNLANMFAAEVLGPLPAFGIAFLKAGFAALTRGGTAGIMSLCGGIFSTAVMLLLFRKDRKLGYVGIGVISAVCHNLGQLCVAAAMVGNLSVLAYLPALLLFGVVAGALTGLICRAVSPMLRKVTARFQIKS